MSELTKERMAELRTVKMLVAAFAFRRIADGIELDARGRE